jgi:hypothetical protein
MEIVAQDSMNRKQDLSILYLNMTLSFSSIIITRVNILQNETSGKRKEKRSDNG